MRAVPSIALQIATLERRNRGRREYIAQIERLIERDELAIKNLKAQL